MNRSADPVANLGITFMVVEGDTSRGPVAFKVSFPSLPPCSSVIIETKSLKCTKAAHRRRGCSRGLSVFEVAGTNFHARLHSCLGATRRVPGNELCTVLQARDLDASQAFYEQYLGLVRSQAEPPHAVVFETKPIAFALRDVVPGTDLASVAQPGIGAAIWLHATDVQAIYDALVADGHTIVSAPIDGPFGRTFTFADPDGYQVTLHDRA